MAPLSGFLKTEKNIISERGSGDYFGTVPLDVKYKL